MLLGELLTVQMHQLAVTVVVFDNSSLGMVEAEMLVEGFPPHGTDVGSVNYAAIAAAIGLDAVRVTDPRDLRRQLGWALSNPRPTLVDVVTDRNALSIPPRVSLKQIRGFATGVGETVLAGGVGKMIDLARSNLRNIRAL